MWEFTLVWIPLMILIFLFTEKRKDAMTKRKFVVMLLVAVLALSVMFTAAPKAEAAGNYTISLADSAGKNTITAKPGDTVTLTLSIANNPGIIGLGVQVKVPTGISIAERPKDVSDFSDIADVSRTFSPSLTTNPYLLWWNMAGGDFDQKLVKQEGKVAEIKFKVADNAAAGEYKITLTAPADKNTTAQVDGSGVIKPNTNQDVTGITVSGCTIKIESTCSNQGHSYGPWKKISETQHSRTCTVPDCGYEDKQNHTWNSGTVTKPANCKEEGVKTHTCTAQGCGDTKEEKIDKTAHTYGDWKDAGNGKHSRTCTVTICGNVETKDHTWNSGTVTKKASCKEAGEKTYTCTACGLKKTEPIKKLTTHTYDNNCDVNCNICGATRTITHKYKTTWSKSKTEHWHVCSVCGEKKDVAAHTPGAEATETKAQKCTECGYVIKAALGHKCAFADTWTTDENGHWYACSGCEEQSSYAAHDFVNDCDPDCSICGYTRETAHKYAEEYSSDETNHWYECSGCGDKQELAAHEPSAEATETTAQTCTICGYVIKEALGGATEPSEEPTEEPTGEPQYNVEVKPDIVIDIPWGIIFAVVGAGVVILVVVLLTKKKNDPLL